MRRFEKRPSETLVISELLDRVVDFNDGSGEAVIADVGVEQQRDGDWLLTQLHLTRLVDKSKLSLRRRGQEVTVPVDAVSGLLTPDEDQGVSGLLASYQDLKPADLAEVIQDLDTTRQLEIAQALQLDRLADVLEELPEEDQVNILSGLEEERAADVLEVMEPDDAADLLHDLPKQQADALLELMEPDEARDVRRLLAYDENTAGGMMTSEPVILAPETTIAQALAHIRRADLTPALASMVFVVRPPLETPTGRLLGVVHFQALLREPPHQAIGSIIDSQIEFVRPDAQLGHVVRLMATYNLLALPVLDGERRLLGAISVDDALDHMLPEDWRETDHNQQYYHQEEDTASAERKGS